MSKGNNIVNPFALPVLKLTIDDQGQSHIETQLSPKDTAKLLSNLAMDLSFRYVEQMAAAAQLGKLQVEEVAIVKP